MQGLCWFGTSQQLNKVLAKIDNEHIVLDSSLIGYPEWPYVKVTIDIIDDTAAYSSIDTINNCGGNTGHNRQTYEEFIAWLKTLRIKL